MNIGLTYDSPDDDPAASYGAEETVEFDEASTIDAIEGALQTLGHATDRIGHARNLIDRLARGDRWDLVFNVCEGLHGMSREAQVPAILDVYEIPYTFANPVTLCVCLDKARTKTVLRAAGVPTPDWFIVRKGSDVSNCKLAFPVIAKPLAESAGKGIDGASKVMDPTALRQLSERLLKQFQQPVLVEHFLPGREFTVGIMGTGSQAEVIGTLEIKLQSHAEPDVYSHVNKEQCEELCEFALVRPSDKRVAEAERIALAAWRAIDGRDGGRVDLRCDAAGNPQLMEVNPLASLHPTRSDLPMIWSGADRPYAELIERIVESASSRSLSYVAELARVQRSSAL
jgi:D-alanine-D-alanine ligase